MVRVYFFHLSEMPQAPSFRKFKVEWIGKLSFRPLPKASQLYVSEISHGFELQCVKS